MENSNHIHHHLDHASHVEMLPNGVEPPESNRIMEGISQHMPHGEGHQNHMQHGSDEMSMMKMYFHYGLGDMVLFRGLVMDTSTKLMLTCLVLFLCGILLEFIDYSRGYLSCRCRDMTDSQNKCKSSSSSSESNLVDSEHNQQNNAGQRQQNWSCCAGTSAPQRPDEEARQHSRENGMSKRRGPYKAKFFPVRSPDPHSYRIIQACLQFIRTGISLALMLVAMTYNLCLIFPILLGSAVGFYIFYRPALDSKSVVCH